MSSLREGVALPGLGRLRAEERRRRLAERLVALDANHQQAGRAQERRGHRQPRPGMSGDRRRGPGHLPKHLLSQVGRRRHRRRLEAEEADDLLQPREL